MLVLVVLFLVNNVLSKVAKANGIEVVWKHQGHHYGKLC
jgi:hypothetical protein